MMGYFLTTQRLEITINVMFSKKKKMLIFVDISLIFFNFLTTISLHIEIQ